MSLMYEHFNSYPSKVYLISNSDQNDQIIGYFFYSTGNVQSMKENIAPLLPYITQTQIVKMKDRHQKSVLIRTSDEEEMRTFTKADIMNAVQIEHRGAQ